MTMTVAFVSWPVPLTHCLVINALRKIQGEIEIVNSLGEAKAVLGKAQKEMKKYTNRKRVEVNNYKVGDLVILSTKDLKYQMVKKRTEKLMKRFVGPYRVKKIVLSNTVKLELSSTVKIHLVVNVSRICRYIGQVEEQRKEQLAPVIIKRKEE